MGRRHQRGRTGSTGQSARHQGSRKRPFGWPGRHQGRKGHFLDSLRGLDHSGATLRFATKRACPLPLKLAQRRQLRQEKVHLDSLDSLRRQEKTFHPGGTREAGKDWLDSLEGTREAGSTAWRHQGGTREAGKDACEAPGKGINGQRLRGTREAGEDHLHSSILCYERALKGNSALRKSFLPQFCATRAQTGSPVQRAGC